MPPIRRSKKSWRINILRNCSSNATDIVTEATTTATATTTTTAAATATTTATGIATTTNVADIATIVTSTNASASNNCGSRNVTILNSYRIIWKASDHRFKLTFLDNDFGYACNVCDRLWFKKDIKKSTSPSILSLLQTEFPEDTVKDFYLCKTCKTSLSKHKIPTLSKSNGFKYPPKPILPELDVITERLISPRLPFMQLRRLRYQGYSIVGQVVNVPVDVQTMVTTLPRDLSDDFSFNVNIKKNLIHKSTYLRGSVKKSVVKSWLSYLQNKELYQMYNIRVDWNQINTAYSVDEDEPCTSRDALMRQHTTIDEHITDEYTDAEIILARQQTLLWDEGYCLNIAPGQNCIPMNILYDKYAEELSFPGIYYGESRKFKENLNITEYMKATSEIRRKDRRGATPHHILYMAMKVMRCRVLESMRRSFKCVPITTNVTRRQIEDPEFLNDCAEKNFAFLKSIPNSMVYWQNRRNDLFAMIRQLGKPTCFLTISANETKWPHLLVILHRLNDHFKNINNVNIENAMDKLNRYMCSHIVNEDPVVCCIYFKKLVATIMLMLQSSKTYNPFGSYGVIDYFIRTEFQHRGSPHAHILLWLDNDPHDKIGENSMAATIQLINALCSVSGADLDDSNKINNQIHKHTFTCYKRGETKCRFNIPYWPINETRILIPLSCDDNRKAKYFRKAIQMKQMLEERNFQELHEFLHESNINYEQYLNIIRSTLQRPTVIFKRKMTEIYINTFHPWIASTLNSNMDLQFILEEYSCAQYVVEYVNKSNRGISQLHRELLRLYNENPDAQFTDLMKKISLKVLNSIEMSAQEAAWYLLRQPMCISSRQVLYVPTVWPHERYKSTKRRAQMDREGLNEDSTDIWTKSIFLKYEERCEMDDVCLADFVSWYSPSVSKRSHQASLHEEYDHEIDHDDNEVEVIFDTNTNNYKKRSIQRILRYRQYDIDDVVNYKREIVTLYYPFRNEHVDIIDNNKFVDIYDNNEEYLMQKRKEYESNINIDVLMAQLRELCENDPSNPNNLDRIQNERNVFINDIVGDGNENNDDFQYETGNEIAVVRKRSNVISKQEYCNLMRLTNKKQRELILEFIHRLCSNNIEPIQVYLAGPAGSGKTFTMKLIMETLNRFGQQQSELRNSYLACASTGKAAVNLNGTTVHSAFRITPHRKSGYALSDQVLQQYRRNFSGVKCVIVDEISMIGCGLFHKINHRLQEITGIYDSPFGKLHMILAGDFRQLPPVNSKPIYKRSNDVIGGNILWQQLHFFNLTQIMRQSDAQFSNILTKIGNGEKLLPIETKLIEDRFRTEQWCKDNLPEVIRLFHRNSSVDAYNKCAITSEIHQVAEDKITGNRTATELIEARTKLHKMSTSELNGFPYLLHLCVGSPYMLTINIDVNDGLVNGVIGILTFIEFGNSSPEEGITAQLQHSQELGPQQHHELDLEVQQQVSQRHQLPQQLESRTEERSIICLWFKFPDEVMGKITRIKYRPHVLSKFSNNLNNALTWTPITKRTAHINITKLIKCKRMQFPVTPAAAITVHKSQGATFQQIVYDYDKGQQNQLVYVGLSRVTNIEGLFMTNAKNDFKFYHAAGNSSPSIKEIKDEYARLETHKLPTLTEAIQRFMIDPNNGTDNTYVAIINAQSLVAHSADIESDSIIMQCHYLMFSETWMASNEPVHIEGFQLVSQSNNTISNTRETNNAQTRRLAAGVAIYRKIGMGTDCTPIEIDISNRRLTENKVGDICLAEVKISNEVIFVLGSVYFHPNVSQSDKEFMLFSSLKRYSHLSELIDANFQVDDRVSLLIAGDFNTEVTSHSALTTFMNDKFKLSYIQNDSVTTLGLTNIDLVFARNLDVSVMNYISYFSYHKPIISKIKL